MNESNLESLLESGWSMLFPILDRFCLVNRTRIEQESAHELVSLDRFDFPYWVLNISDFEFFFKNLLFPLFH